MKIRRIILGFGLAVVLFSIALVIYFYPAFSFFLSTEQVQVDKNLDVYLGGGGNSGVLVTDKAVVVIDTKMMGSAEDLYKAAKQKAGKLPIIVINTHYHSDHTSGNKFYKGSKIYIGGYDTTFLKQELKGENMPTDYVKDSLILDLGNETLMLYNTKQAHTRNDMVVYLKNRKILFSGDLVFNKINPVILKKSGADVDKWMSVLDRLQSKFDIAKVVPGHGSIGGKEIIAAMWRYFADMKEGAMNPNTEEIMKKKYAGWQALPAMSSPGKTIDYIKEGK